MSFKNTWRHRRTLELRLQINFISEMSFLSCTICVGNFEAGQQFKSTVCGHLYHSRCLEEWNAKSKTCPDCRHCLKGPLSSKAVFLKFTEDNDRDRDREIKTLGEHVKSLEKEVTTHKNLLNEVMDHNLELEKQLDILTARKRKRAKKDWTNIFYFFAIFWNTFCQTSNFFSIDLSFNLVGYHWE